MICDLRGREAQTQAEFPLFEMDYTHQLGIMYLH